MLVGRRDELAAVQRLVASGGMVVLVGPAGIGKTTLARAALGGTGSYREGGALATLAWSPLLVFRRLLHADPPELPEAVAGAVLKHGNAPLLLDDLQWADDASLAAVAQLVGRIPVVATVRTGEERSDEVVGALVLVGAEQIDLTGLADDSAIELAANLHPTLTQDERQALVRTAHGNPLLLAELPRGSEAAPSLVSALIGRVASLSAAGRVAVERLAVLGRPATPELLGVGTDEVVRAGLALADTDRVTIRHSLLGEVIADGLGTETADAVRRDLVPLVGAAEGAHLLLASGDVDGARRLALEAATDGDRRRQATMLALAVSCAPDLDAHNRIRAARLFTSISEPAMARSLCAVDGREDLDRVDRGALFAVEAEAAWLQGRHRESFALLERALADLEGTRTPYEAAALAGSTVSDTFVGLDGRPALERARAAVALADEIGAVQGYTRARLASVLMTSGEPGWAELYHEVMDLAVAEDDDDLRRTALVSLVLAHWATGDPKAAEAVARAEVAVGPRQDFDATWLTIVAYASVLGLVTGRPRCELLAEFAPILDQWPSFRSRPFLDAAVALSHADLGEHPAAAARVRDGLAQVGGEAQWRSIVMWTQVESDWLAGRLAAAVDGAGRLVDLGMGDYPAAVQGRLAGAHAALEHGAELVGPAPGALLPAWQAAPVEWQALVHASKDEAGDAVGCFVDAAELWAPNDVRSEVRCRWAAGDVAARSALPVAVELLDAAGARAAQHGLIAMTDRVRASLRIAGVSRRADAAPRPTGLTAREEQVVDLVGAGMTTAEVAAALRIEASTVESFVRSAMRKLGVSTRTGAAARLAEARGAALSGEPGGSPTR